MKKDNLRAIVSNIVCKNPILYAVIRNRHSGLYSKFIINVTNDKNSYASKKNSEVKLGIGNLAKLCDICIHFCQLYQLELGIDNNILSFQSDDEVYIDCYDINEKDLDNIEFLKDNSIDTVGTLAIYALTYTLFHEFGHVKYDADSMIQIEKERTADNFALEILRKLCNEEPNGRLEENPSFLGAYLDNIVTLLVSKAKDAEISMSHPHPIERIYLFLEYFHIDDNSYLWRYAYDTIVKWANDNNLAMTFEKDSSISIKDKMLDAYHRFKK